MKVLKYGAMEERRGAQSIFRRIVVREIFYQKVFGDNPGDSSQIPPDAEVETRKIEQEWLCEPHQDSNLRRSILVEPAVRRGEEGFVIKQVVSFTEPLDDVNHLIEEEVD